MARRAIVSQVRGKRQSAGCERVVVGGEPPGDQRQLLARGLQNAQRISIAGIAAAIVDQVQLLAQ